MNMLNHAGVLGFVDTLEVIRGLQRQQKLKFPNKFLKTKAGKDSLSQTSIYSAIHGKLPDGAHQADSDVLNLINIVAYSTLIKAFRKATPTPIAAIFEKVTKKRPTAKNNCSLKKKEKLNV